MQPFSHFASASLITAALLLFLFLAPALPLAADPDPPGPTRCELLPLPHNEVSFTVDGVEKTRWHFGADYPRPFFYPFNAPSGASLTRIGHPGAPNHDHHLSVWFAHTDVGGTNFWSNTGDGRIRQKSWLAYLDGEEEALMASLLGWFDGADRELMEQELVAALRPRNDGDHELELQVTLRPAPKAQSVELGKTNFGLLAVRVAKSISHHFGGGNLTDSEGRLGEKAVFGNTAAWMDYTGPVAADKGAGRRVLTGGITFFDHPSNPRYPTHWHVRDDGWMGASFCMQEGFTITAREPLVLRYLLLAHAGPCDPARANAVAESFASRPGFQVTKATRPHHQYDVGRDGSPAPGK